MTKDVIQKKREVPEYKENPFLKDLANPGVMMVKPKQNSFIAKSEGIIDFDTGEVQKDALLLARRKFVDQAEFAKIYAKNVGFIFDLSKSTQKVFRYLLEGLKYDNTVILNPNQTCESEGIVRTTFDRAVKNLLHYKVIAKSINVHIYFVNPVFICKGERFAMYTEFRRKASQLNLFEDQNQIKGV